MEEDVQQSHVDTMFICGLCKIGYNSISDYYLHMKSHNEAIAQSFHLCPQTAQTMIIDKKGDTNNGDKEIDKQDKYKCHMCLSEFGTICMLHDHLMACVKTESYIYDASDKTAYPIGELCSFDTDRADEDSNGIDQEEISSRNDRKTKRRVDSKVCVDDSSELSYVYKFWLDFHRAYTGSGRSTARKNDETMSDTFYGITDQNVATIGSFSDNDSETPSQVKGGPVKRKRGRPKLKDTQSKRKSNKSGKEDNINIRKLKHGSQNTRKTLKQRKDKHALCSKRKENKKSSSKQKLKNDDNLIERIIVKEELNEPELGEENTDSLEQIDVINETLRPNGMTEFKGTGSQCDSSPDNIGDINYVSSEEIADSKEELTDFYKKRKKIKSYKLKANVLKKTSTQVRKRLKINKKEDNDFSDSDNDDLGLNNEDGKNDYKIKGKKKCGRKKLDLTKCEVCDKLVKRSKLKVHAISHSDVRPYACKHCPKTYKYSEHLNMHLKSHNEVLPFYCEICGQGFIDVNRLKRHTMMHTDDKPFKCTECDSAFVTKYKLNRHMFVHTGLKSMQCDLCGMRFAHKESLSSHISGIHRKERRFPCLECDKHFFTNYQLKCHAMKHSGIRPHKCSHCKADFIERKELRRHMRKLHNLSLEGQTIDIEKTKNVEMQMDIETNSEQNKLISIKKDTHVSVKSCDANLPTVINTANSYSGYLATGEHVNIATGSHSNKESKHLDSDMTGNVTYSEKFYHKHEQFHKNQIQSEGNEEFLRSAENTALPNDGDGLKSGKVLYSQVIPHSSFVYPTQLKPPHNNHPTGLTSMEESNMKDRIYILPLEVPHSKVVKYDQGQSRVTLFEGQGQMETTKVEGQQYSSMVTPHRAQGNHSLYLENL